MKKILVIDDNYKVLLVTEKLIKLAASDMEVVTATSGAQGIKLAAEQHPNVILLDILMPEMDGYEACRKLKSTPETEDIPVVLISSIEFNKENRLKAIDARADGFVTKPIDKQELTLQLQAMLKINEGNLRKKYEQERLQELVDEQTKELRMELQRRKETEQRLQKHEKHLEELNATKDKFFSIIAHDLKSPFSNVLGLSELLAEKSKQKDYDNFDHLIQMLKKAAEQSNNLLQNLLEWSRTQLGSQNFEPVKQNLYGLIDGVVNVFSVVAEEKCIGVKIHCDDGMVVNADPNMLKTVLRNLISNALKYSYPKSEVKISVAEKDTEILISVQDFGTGIDSKWLPKLFQIGENISMPGTRNEKGTGIGLILCKEFVEIHGGKIWAESKPPNGTTFFFTLPVVQP